MRLLANEDVPLDVVEAFRTGRHDVAWIRTLAPGSTDQAVLERAVAEDRILVTFDKDFGELIFNKGVPPPAGIILFRFSLPSPSSAAQKAVAALASRTDWEGHLRSSRRCRSA